MAQQGGIQCVINSMRSHQLQIGVQVSFSNLWCTFQLKQESGCGVLWNLALYENNRIKIGNEGGVTCIIGAMEAHKQSPEIQETCCGALWNLSVNGDFLLKHVNFTLN